MHRAKGRGGEERRSQIKDRFVRSVILRSTNASLLIGEKFGNKSAPVTNNLRESGGESKRSSPRRRRYLVCSMSLSCVHARKTGLQVLLLLLLMGKASRTGEQRKQPIRSESKAANALPQTPCRKLLKRCSYLSLSHLVGRLSPETNRHHAMCVDAPDLYFAILRLWKSASVVLK